MSLLPSVSTSSVKRVIVGSGRRTIARNFHRQEESGVIRKAKRSGLCGERLWDIANCRDILWLYLTLVKSGDIFTGSACWRRSHYASCAKGLGELAARISRVPLPEWQGNAR